MIALLLSLRNNIKTTIEKKKILVPSRIKTENNLELSTNRGGLDFIHKKWGLGKIVEVVLKKGVFLIFILTLSSVIFFLSALSKCLVCMCVFCLFTPFQSAFFISWEEFSLIVSNHQISDFSKWVIFEKQRHFGK